MFRPLPISIGLRYLHAKTHNGFISFIAAVAGLGITIGVMVLITVLSVMNGFSQEVKQHLFDVAQHVTIYKPHQKFPELEAKKLQQSLAKNPRILASAPFVLGQALISAHGQVSPLLLFGIDPAQEQGVSPINTALIQGNLKMLNAGQFQLLAGADMANKLGLDIGSKVTVVTPKASHSIVGLLPRFKRFHLTGAFRFKDSHTLNDQAAYTHWQDAQALFNTTDQVTGVRLKISDMDQAPQLANQLQKSLGPDYQVNNWTQQFADFFRALQLEKTMMFIVLLLIIIIAAFNLVTGLVMLVTDKQQDIAVLRTLGLTPKKILCIFVTQGLAIGVIGTAIGAGCGILLAGRITPIVSGLEQLLHTKLMPASVYLINYLPAKVVASDVWQVCALSIGLSLIATLYPAYRAARVNPAEVLRYA